jgi:hypothetical protein
MGSIRLPAGYAWMWVKEVQFNPSREALWLAESAGEALVEFLARKAVILRSA